MELSTLLYVGILAVVALLFLTKRPSPKKTQLSIVTDELERLRKQQNLTEELKQIEKDMAEKQKTDGGLKEPESVEDFWKNKQ